MMRRGTWSVLVFVILGMRGEARADEEGCSAAHVRAQLLKRDNPDKLLERRIALRACSSRSCARSIVDACSGWLREVDALMPSLTVAVVDERGARIDEATILVDGRAQTEGRATELDPGEHSVVVRTARSSQSRTVVVRSGERDRVERVTLAESASEHTMEAGEKTTTWPAYATLGLAGAGVAASTVFGVLWVKGVSGCSRHNACPDSFDTESANAKLQTFAVGFWVGAGVALIAGSLGTWLLLSNRTAQKPDARAHQPPRVKGHSTRIEARVAAGWIGVEGEF